MSSSFSRFFSRAPPTPQITSADSPEVAGTKLLEILTGELAKQDVRYFAALGDFVHFINQSFAIMNIAPLDFEAFKMYMDESKRAVAKIEIHNKDLADSLFNYIAILQYGVKVELTKKRKNLREFSSKFPPIPDGTLANLQRRLNALKRSGGRRRRRTHRRRVARHRTRKTVRS